MSIYIDHHYTMTLLFDNSDHRSSWEVEGVQSFLRYLESSWFNQNNSWFHGYAPGIPSTNMYTIHHNFLLTAISLVGLFHLGWIERGCRITRGEAKHVQGKAWAIPFPHNCTEWYCPELVCRQGPIWPGKIFDITFQDLTEAYGHEWAISDA